MRSAYLTRSPTAQPHDIMQTGPSKEDILRDYRLGVRSREASLIGRREVLGGKAKFGIFGDGKEVAQLALAKVFRPGDFRSGYYRDQTLMMALGLLDVEAFFAQLYADPDVAREPASAGRQMNAHFATRLLDKNGEWLPQTAGPNCAADSSPTGSQMPRLAGLAYASRLYRELPALHDRTDFSHHGDEIAFGTIGNASCAEGMFWETVNAVGVLRAPMLLSIWDDEYGISVSNEYQIAKGDLSALLRGFAHDAPGDSGYDLYTVVGWDYAALCDTYARAAAKVRSEHAPAIVHVIEMTQPQGHSTSGSHERYKSAERLAWEEEFDCLRRMRSWICDHGVADEDALVALEDEERQIARAAQRRAWDAFMAPIHTDRQAVLDRIEALADASPSAERLRTAAGKLARVPNPIRRDMMVAVREALFATRDEADHAARHALLDWRRTQQQAGEERYSTHLHSQSAASALRVVAEPPRFDAEAPALRGFEVLNRCFDAALARMPELIAFGEDLGKLGDVNQGFLGLQEKYGALRVGDTGIRECTILGQAIGMAMRGLRPLAEIQYLDYVLYALQIISDDLATLQYRTRGGQKAPVVIRSRGHRLEGIWHAGSPMAGLLGLIRGVWLCVPRDMTRAAGFYNTLLQSDDSAIVVEVLNGYRLKEQLPTNIDRFTLPLGVPETLRAGEDVTLVTYGACCRVALEAAQLLDEVGIDIEVIDVQTLLPFDREHRIAASLRRTNRLLLLDEDVPGGATAFMLQNVLEEQGGYHWLDGEPRTVTAQAHRPAYGSDGDHWSKPNVDDVFEAVYELMHESAPGRFPIFYR